MLLSIFFQITKASVLPNGVRKDQEPFDRLFGRHVAKLLTEPIPSNNPWQRIQIVDARWALEFAGGHIRGAINCHCHFDDVKKFYDEYYSPTTLFVIQCEFSAYRGPTIARHMINLHSYGPHAFEPLWIAVLDGGFSQFYLNYQNLCDGEYWPEERLDHRNIKNKEFLKRARSIAGDIPQQQFL
jgi:M-phase inducer tyrosine phosphatase